jgi:DNA-binding NtrC family response regulator
MRKYHWHGNVRELENIIQRVVLMAENEIIDVPDLPDLMKFSSVKEGGFNRSLEEVELEYIRNVLASVDGNRTLAAKILGIDRKTLREKMRFTE